MCVCVCVCVRACVLVCRAAHDDQPRALRLPHPHGYGQRAEEARRRAVRAVTRVPGRVPSYHTSPVIRLLTNSSVASLAVTARSAIWFDCRAPRASDAGATKLRKAGSNVSGSAPPRHKGQ